MANHSSLNSLISRMNFNCDYETLFLLEEEADFNLSIIEENECSFNEINAFLNIVNVRYESSLEIEEKKCKINELKKNFDFIKIIHKKNNEKNEINFLILNNKKYKPSDIQDKINEKAVFGNLIKKTLKIDEFPIDKYVLEELENENQSFYDQIFVLKNIKKENLNMNNINMNDNNDIVDKIDELNYRIDNIEENYNKKFIEINQKLDDILSILKKNHQ